MIVCIGLPRSGGQTLQHALSTLLGGKVWHSVEPHRIDVLNDPETTATVECFFPVFWICDNFDGVRFILNRREEGPWYESCKRVYAISQERNWSHPMWRYHPDQFIDYRNDYHAIVLDSLFRAGCDYMTWDPTIDPRWKPLCDFLGVAQPAAPFPNVDNHGRAPTQALGNPFGDPFGGSLDPFNPFGIF